MTVVDAPQGPFSLDNRHGIGLVTSLTDPPDRSKESVWEEPSDEVCVCVRACDRSLRWFGPSW